MRFKQSYSSVLKALFLSVTLGVLSSSVVTGAEPSPSLNRELAPLSWQLGTWKWSQLEGDVVNSGVVEIRSGLNGTAIFHDGHSTAGGEFRFHVSVAFDPQRGVPVARGSNNHGEVWQDLVGLFEGRCVMRRTYINAKPVMKIDGTQSEGMGIHTRIITQTRINHDTWKHEQVLILPSGKAETRFVARLERVK